MQLKLHMVTIEDLVPEDHFLRKLEAALDLPFVYEETPHLYSRKYGRSPIDPVVTVKYLLLGFLYGIPSERQVWCEGTFAAQKWRHNLTRLLRRGLEAAEDHCLLSAAALNLKRMIKHSV